MTVACSLPVSTHFVTTGRSKLTRNATRLPGIQHQMEGAIIAVEIGSASDFGIFFLACLNVPLTQRERFVGFKSSYRRNVGAELVSKWQIFGQFLRILIEKARWTDGLTWEEWCKDAEINLQ